MRILFVSLIFLISCSEPTNVENDNTNDYVYCEAEYSKSKRLLKLKSDAYKAIQTGDTILYDNAATLLLLGPRPEELTYFATAMALKHNCGEAYFHVYMVYDMSHFNILEENIELEPAMRNYLLYNLSKSFELGVNPNGTFLGGEITKENIESSDYYLKKMLEINQTNP